MVIPAEIEVDFLSKCSQSSNTQTKHTHIYTQTWPVWCSSWNKCETRSAAMKNKAPLGTTPMYCGYLCTGWAWETHKHILSTHSNTGQSAKQSAQGQKGKSSVGRYKAKLSFEKLNTKASIAYGLPLYTVEKLFLKGQIYHTWVWINSKFVVGSKKVSF